MQCGPHNEDQRLTENLEESEACTSTGASFLESSTMCCSDKASVPGKMIPPSIYFRHPTIYIWCLVCAFLRKVLFDCSETLLKGELATKIINSVCIVRKILCSHAAIACFRIAWKVPLACSYIPCTGRFILSPRKKRWIEGIPFSVIYSSQKEKFCDIC